MKICFIVGAFPNMKCGVGDYTRMLSEELANEGNEISIITSKKAQEVNISKYRVYNIVDEWNFTSKDIILDRLREINPDVVHIQYPSDEYSKSLFINLLPRMVKKQIGCKVVETVHEYISYTAKGKLRNLMNYLYADNLIVVENQYKEMIQSFLPLISKKINIEYVPISSNIPKSSIDQKDIKEIREKLHIGNSKVISYFGFVNELKGIEILIDAFYEIVNKGEDAKLLILSELNPNNEYQNKTLELINKRDIKDKVIITGFIDSSEKVADYLRISDLAILPFRDGLSERNGSFLAAYNQGIPIITTGINRIDSNKVYFIEPNNKEQLVKKYFEIKDELTLIERNVLSWHEIGKSHLKVYE